MKTYESFIKDIKNSKIRKNYKSVIKLTKPEFEIKLSINIIYFYKIFNVIFDNSNLDLNCYKINLLIISSFSRLFNLNNSNIQILENKIREQNIHELYNVSLNILKNIYKIILIKTKKEKDLNLLFRNNDILQKIFEFTNNKKLNIYNFTNKDINNEILNYIKKNMIGVGFEPNQYLYH